MTIQSSYTPSKVTGSTAVVTVPIGFPFSGTIADLYVVQQNLTTKALFEDGVGSSYSLRQVGTDYFVDVTNNWGAGVSITVTVYRNTDTVQNYGQDDGTALDAAGLEAQLDTLVKKLQETAAGSNGRSAITSLDPFEIPPAPDRVNTMFTFDANGDIKLLGYIITGADENRLVTINSDGELVISNIDYDPATGIMQIFNDDKLTLQGGVGMDGFDFTINGKTDPATSKIEAQAAELTNRVATSATETESNTSHDITATVLNFFKKATGLTRAFRIWGGATGGDGDLEITVNESSASRANFQGSVNEFNFIGQILQNGVPITDAVTNGQYNSATFDAGDILTDAGGDYYLFGHNFDTEDLIFVQVEDQNGEVVEVSNWVRDPSSASTLKNNIKVYINDLTITGTWKVGAFTGGLATVVPGQLTADEVAGVKNAITPASAANPFVTVADQTAAQLTPAELDAIHGASSPSGVNVFLTAADQQLTSDELAGIQGSATPVTGANPVVTVADKDLTADEKSAVKNANTPTGVNPFATIADIGGSFGAITVPTTLYVSTSGDDVTGDGTAGNPWATIDRARVYLRNYSLYSRVTISVAAGSYVFPPTAFVYHPQGHLIDVVGAGAGSTTLTGNFNIDTTDRFGSIANATISGQVTIDGFMWSFTNCTFTAAGDAITVSNGGVLDQVFGCTFSSNNRGIIINNIGVVNYVQNCTFTTCSIGIYGAGAGGVGLVTGTTFTGGTIGTPANIGIRMWGGGRAGIASSCTFEYCATAITADFRGLNQVQSGVTLTGNTTDYSPAFSTGGTPVWSGGFGMNTHL